ncbi:exodeoxyribonuclease VII large subunit [Desulfatiferula olefinivorans]
MNWHDQKPRATIYSVSSLTSEIKTLLEDRYPFVWIQGEISNLSRPASGHLYFTLKDARAQIAAVVFKNLAHHLPFKLESGLQINGLARLSVYEPRGTYQLIFEHLEPKGAGALQLAFEQLKKRLAREGLFDDKYKQPLPYLPRRISVITSPTGAVIHDIIHVLNRRFPNLVLEVVPVKVQGDSAVDEMVSALDLVNSRNNSDLIIIARGGGSLEDLAPFNSEDLARAVFASAVPVISAVGHETDFTICDFVADMRAPTPSAAAERAVPVKQDLDRQIIRLRQQLTNAVHLALSRKRQSLEGMIKKMVDPRRRITDLLLLTEDMTQRMIRAVSQALTSNRSALDWRKEKLHLVSPAKQLHHHARTLSGYRERLAASVKRLITHKSMALQSCHGRIQALSPYAILGRGYSITRTLPDAVIVREADQVSPGREVEVILLKGRLTCRVEGTASDGQKK